MSALTALRRSPSGIIALQTGAFGLAYFLSAHLGFWLSIKPNLFTPFWPPSGLYLAVLLCTRMRHWPWFILAAVCGNIGFDLTTGKAIEVSLLFSLGNTLEAITGAYAFRKIVGVFPSMERVRDIVALVLVPAAASTCISASIGAAIISHLLAGNEPFRTIWLRWWSGDALSILIFTPLLLTLFTYRKAFSPLVLFPRTPPKFVLEKIGWSILFLAVLRLVFLETPNDLISYKYFFWPLLIWAALRFRMASILLINLSIALFGAWAMSQGYSHFAAIMESNLHPHISLQIFLIVLIASGLVFAAISNERRKHQETLRESERLLKLSQRIATLGHYVFEVRTGSWTGSEMINKIFGIDGTFEKSLAGWLSLLHPEERDAMAGYLSDYVIRDKNMIDKHFRIVRHNDGEVRWVHGLGNLEFDSNGCTVKIFGTMQDITERVIAEEELRKNEKRYRTIVEHITDAFIIHNFNGRILDCNDHACQLFECSREHLIGSSLYDYINPTERIHMAERRKKMLGTGALDFDAEHLRKDGSIIAISASSQVISREGDSVIQSFVHDISERKRSEAALIQSEQRYRSIVENVNDAFYIHDFDGIISDCNDNACRMLGYSREELVGASLKQIDGLKEGHLMPARMKKLMASGTLVFDGDHVRKDGSTVTVNVSARIVSREGNGVVQSFVRDITDLKLADDNMMKAEKLESLGLLAGGIAHDFNNLLAGIFGNIDLALVEAESGKVKDAARILTKAMSVFDRAKDLTRQLLTFAKGGAPVKTTGNIGKTLRDTVQFALSGSNVRAAIDFPEGLWSCDYDPHQIGQVIDNMIINAKQAMPQGGEMEVRAENNTIESESPTQLQPGKYVRIVIRDHGIGIPVEYQQKIFDPFFSTKQAGSGLGLATCWSIIKRHNGHIDVSSRPGIGSTFFIYLPASTSASNIEGEHPSPAKKGTGKILVMDDEPYIRDFAIAIFTSLGYTVTAAADGEETIELFRAAHADGNPFKAVLLDLTIPGGLGGKDTVAILRKLDPSVKAIATSGYTDDPVMADPENFGFAASLGKPYRKAEAAEVLAKVIRCR